MKKKSRVRGPNFTCSENLLLCDIISKYINVIENKKTDGANLLQKQEAWTNVNKEFNAINSGQHRTVESLQMNYKNLKKKAKKNFSDAKVNIPGGEPPPECDDDLLLEKVKSLVGCTIDGVYTELRNIDPIEVDVIVKDEITSMENGLGTSEEPAQPTYDIASTSKTCVTQDVPSTHFTNNRANLKRKPHAIFMRKRKLQAELPERKLVSEKYKVLVAEKVELVNLQKELLKVQILEEQEKLEHNRLLRSMELEDASQKYAHNDKLRKLELEKILNKEV